MIIHMIGNRAMANIIKGLETTFNEVVENYDKMCPTYRQTRIENVDYI